MILRGSAAWLDPSLFKKTFRPGDWAGFSSNVPTITYRGSEYYFSIAEYVDERNGRIVPGSFAIAKKPGNMLKFETLQPVTWDDVASHFDRWLTALKSEIEAPDLWTELTGDRGALAVPLPRNTPFTPEEQQKIRAQLDRIQGEVLADLQLTADQGTAFRSDMDYLKESAARSGRRDWRLQVLGMLGSWALGSILPPDRISEIWNHHVVPLLHSRSGIAQHLPRLGP